MRATTLPGNPALSPRVTDTRPWYRHAFVWLILAILAWSVVAGLGLVYIAVTHADDVVSDTWYRDGRGINRDMAAEQRADAFGIGFSAERLPQGTRLRLRSAVTLPDAASLTLALRHPTQAVHDRTLVFVPQPDGSYFSDDALPAGRRVMTLTPDGAHWRLYREIMIAPSGTLEWSPSSGGMQ